MSVLGIWTIAGILKSDDNTREFITKNTGPYSTLIPTWSFFAPTPGQADYYVFFRDRRVDGAVTNWQRVERFGMERKLEQILWNPDVYRDKGLFDVVDHLNRTLIEEEVQEIVDDRDEQSQDDTETGIADADDMPEMELESIDLGERQGSIMYLLLLNCVTAEEHSPLSEATQFAIMEHSRRYNQYEPLFVSKFHKLDQ